MTTTDVAIVGGGPAGAWAARRLALAGARVAVFDGSHPREKRCGGGLTARAVALVSDAVSLQDLDGLAVSLFRLETATGDRHATSVTLNSPASQGAPLVVVSRARLDGALVAAAVQAGAAIVKERVVDVEVGSDRVRLRTASGTHDASFVVGADGVTSLVRRRLGAPFTRSQLVSAAGFYVHTSHGSEAVIRFGGDRPGYLWALPRHECLAVGIGAPAGMVTSAQLQSEAAAWLHEAGLAGAGRLEPYAWPIPSLAVDDLDQQRPADDRWALVGDAAGLADALTGEGIYYALRSGELIASALVASRERPASRYLAGLARQLYPELRRAAALRARFFTPAFIALLVRALADSPAIRTVMVDLIMGAQPYRGLRGRLLRTGELTLAWRLLALLLREQPTVVPPTG